MLHKTLLNKPINKNANKMCGRLAICGRALLPISTAGQVDALRSDVRSSPDAGLFLCVRGYTTTGTRKKNIPSGS